MSKIIAWGKAHKPLIGLACMCLSFSLIVLSFLAANWLAFMLAITVFAFDVDYYLRNV